MKNYSLNVQVNKINLVLAHINNRRANTYFYYEYFLFKYVAKLMNNVIFISSYGEYHEVTKDKLLQVNDRELFHVLMSFYRRKIINKMVMFFEYGAYSFKALLTIFLFSFLVMFQNRKPSLLVIYHGPFIDKDNLHLVRPLSYVSYLIFHKVMRYLAVIYIVFSKSHKERMEKIGIKRVIAIPFGNYDYEDIVELTKKDDFPPRITIPETPYVLVFGIISPRKNIENVVLSYIRNRNNIVKLIIAGSVSKHISTMHASTLLQILKNKELLSRYGIYIIDRFINDKEAVSLIEKAQAIIIPYLSDITTSGVLAFCFGMNKKVVVPESNKYFHDYVDEKCRVKNINDIISTVPLLNNIPTCKTKWGNLPISLVAKIFAMIVNNS